MNISHITFNILKNMGYKFNIDPEDIKNFLEKEKNLKISINVNPPTNSSTFTLDNKQLFRWNIIYDNSTIIGSMNDSYNSCLEDAIIVALNMIH